MLIHEGKVDRTSQWSVKSLPPEMVEASIKRVGIIAAVYAFTFFTVSVLPALIDPIARGYFFSKIENWLPPAVSIVTALLVILAMRADIGRDIKIRLGILFEIIGSYGIAFAEYHDVVSGIVYHDMAGPGGVGLSWVAPWVMLFTIAIPTPPRTALTAALLSVSAVPVVLGLSIAGGGTEFALTGGQFFAGLILPNLLIVGMAYVGARIVYRMGKAVREAHEMGSYRLVERLGKGAMGEVWRAEHRTLARPAAIKLIRPEVLHSCDHHTRSSCTTSGSPTKAPSTTSWNSSTGSIWINSSSSLGRCRRSAPYTSFATWLIRSPKRMTQAWCTGTSSPPTCTPAVRGATWTS